MLSLSVTLAVGAALFRAPAVRMCAMGNAPVSADSPRTVRLISGLRAADFQHPDDKRAADVLKLLAPIEWGLRNAFKAFVEDAVFLENIASGVLVGPKQLPDIHKMLIETCQLLGLEQVPDLYIRQSASPNAYTLAVQGRRPFIVCTTALLDLLEPEELQAVIAHEAGHLKCEHSLAIAMANLVLSPLASVSPVLSASLQTNLLRWQRAAELSCDRAALLVVQDVRAVQSVTMKLAGGGTTFARRLDVDAFVQQAAQYDEVADGSRIGRMVRSSQQRDATHPLPVYRVRELQRFAQSEEYKRLMARGQPMRVEA